MEPFGYFRVEPFGWTDCAETDDGARPLYEKSQIDELRKQLSTAKTEGFNDGIEASVAICRASVVESVRLADAKGQPAPGTTDYQLKYHYLAFATAVGGVRDKIIAIKREIKECEV